MEGMQGTFRTSRRVLATSRVGDYRLIMYFERNQLVIVLTDVGHRSSIYS